jgi:hypothetical protein
MKASDDHRPRIIIRATEWSMRKRDIAAPERSDLLPMSEGRKPKVVSPPNSLQTDRSMFRTNVLLMRRGLSLGCVVQMGVVGCASRTVL